MQCVWQHGLHYRVQLRQAGEARRQLQRRVGWLLREVEHAREDHADGRHVLRQAQKVQHAPRGQAAWVIDGLKTVLVPVRLSLRPSLVISK
jgi:hypothetical protein